MVENPGSPAVFADRYRFQPVSDDWDRGRSGFTHLVFDMKKERLGVIKRAELASPQAVEGLKNEVAALLDLKGRNVPQVYDTGEAEYGSKYYFYVVIEYLDAIRVEKALNSLSASERIEIIRQLFGLLAKAHGLGIVNGDVDLKHLFWRRDKKQLVVIDWGNAKLDVDRKRQVEFTPDLIRTAGVVHALTVRQVEPSAPSSVELPKTDKELFPGLSPIPVKIRELCKWAARSVINRTPAPHSAEELSKAAMEWRNPKPVERTRTISITAFGLILTFLSIFLFVFGGWDKLRGFLSTPTQTATELPITPSSVTLPTETPTLTITPTSSPTIVVENTSTPTQTAAPPVTPSPRAYIQPLFLIDKNNLPKQDCFENSPVIAQSGFNKRDDGYWGFGIDKGIAKDTPIQTGFSHCVEIAKVNAIGINVWISKIETDLISGKEFGIFLVSKDGRRRDYTIWIDKSASMHLTVRENFTIVVDEKIAVVDDPLIKILDVFPRKIASFPIQYFIEFDNYGLDIIYLRQGPLQEAVGTNELNPNEMKIPNNNAVLPTFGELQEIGLVGFGGEINTIIWPLVLFGE